MSYVPNIQVTNVDVAGDRTLTLTHTIQNRVPLSTDGIDEVLKHLRSLWGFDIVLESVEVNDDPKKEDQIWARFTQTDSEDTEYVEFVK
jgi:spore cortex formation protein SpoVR/YcgB (stage V sporulation)